MADIELVIKIPEEAYNLLQNGGVDWLGAEHILDRVANGIPLPKNHGDLIDRSKIYKAINNLKDNWNRYGNEYECGRYESYDYAVDTIDEAQTIIEADKGE